MKLKLKSLLKWSLTLTSLSLAASTISCKNNYDQKLEDEDRRQVIKTDNKLKYQAFINDIIDSGTNPYPSVFIGRNASQYLISSAYSMLGQLQIAKSQTVKSPYNDVIYLIDTVVNDYQQTLNNVPQRFNYGALLDKFGDTALKDANGNLNVNAGTLRVINNSSALAPNKYSYEYSVFPRSKEELLAYLDGYLDKVDQFDFYIPDISFIALDWATIEWIIAHANKIVILSMEMHNHIDLFVRIISHELINNQLHIAKKNF
ncbi:hypothetical protein ACNQ1O_01050 [Mycoplasma sp. B6188]|uniref:hypothetical protein n=1 Tax=Mycoplasma sp. B6188 TaxID=3401673 RepID=UPI003AAFAA81